PPPLSTLFPYTTLFRSARRTVYQVQQRLRRRRILEVFDGADPNATTPDRPLSTTALQALYLMNDPFVHDRAGELAGRVESASPEDRKSTRLNSSHDQIS